MEHETRRTISPVADAPVASSSQTLDTHAIAQQVQADHSKSSTPSEQLLRDLSSAPSGTPTLPSLNTKNGSVKHVRSRTGCLACKRRRIKCDEVHPVCGWCQSHGSECLYPGVQSETVIAAALSVALSERSCLTCKGRKIKCDRALPICERCQKDGRGCSYPVEDPFGKLHLKPRTPRISPTDPACLVCKIQKTKCDRTHPTCLRCQRLKKECSYPDVTNRLSQLKFQARMASIDPSSCSSPSKHASVQQSPIPELGPRTAVTANYPQLGSEATRAIFNFVNIAGGVSRESSTHPSPLAQQSNFSSATTVETLIGNIIRQFRKEGETDLAALIELTEGDFTSLGWNILARLPGFLRQYEAMSRAVGESDSGAGAALAKILLRSGPLSDALRKQILLADGDIPMPTEENQGTTASPTKPGEREQAQRECLP